MAHLLTILKQVLFTKLKFLMLGKNVPGKIEKADGRQAELTVQGRGKTP